MTFTGYEVIETKTGEEGVRLTVSRVLEREDPPVEPSVTVGVRASPVGVPMSEVRAARRSLQRDVPLGAIARLDACDAERRRSPQAAA